jgi:hypothetical protein
VPAVNENVNPVGIQRVGVKGRDEVLSGVHSEDKEGEPGSPSCKVC